MSKTRPQDFYNRRGPAPAVNSDLSQQIGRIVFEGLLREAQLPNDFVALTVPRSSKSIAPARLAASKAAGTTARDELQALYERCLHDYRERVRPHDATLGQDDAGAALAFFVAVNLNALQDVELTHELLQRLERQLIGLARMTSAWEAASIRDRQLYFEQLAILGMLVASFAERARGEGGDAIAKVRSTARAYLRQLFAFDPDLLALDASGLALRAQPQDTVRVNA
jgi:hypothetical protein